MFDFFKKRKAINELALALSNYLFAQTSLALKLNIFWTTAEKDPFIIGYINGRLRSTLPVMLESVNIKYNISLNENDLMMVSAQAIQRITGDLKRSQTLTGKMKNELDYIVGSVTGEQVSAWLLEYANIEDSIDFDFFLILGGIVLNHDSDNETNLKSKDNNLTAIFGAEYHYLGSKFEKHNC